MTASWQLLQGDARDRLGGLPSASVQCCVTSPPYFGLRHYGVEDQLGREATPEEYVAALVEVLQEVRRVLRDDGTLWLNLGDSYCGSASGRTRVSDREAGRTSWDGAFKVPSLARRAVSKQGSNRRALPGLKPKDLIGIPWMVAFALRADGWYLRRDIIWSKPNPMPESVRDRPASSHEYVFLLSKQRRYYYDAFAIREDAVSKSASGNGYARKERLSYQASDGTPRGQQEGWDDVGGTRNRRSVWTIPTSPYRGAHFATFPPQLVEPCILAGTAPQACSECGTPYTRIVGPGGLDASRPQTARALELARRRGLTDEHVAAIRAAGVSDAGKSLITTNGAGRNSADVLRLAAEGREALGGYYRELLLARPKTVGWQVPCGHEAQATSCVVLDPFAGAGTTGLVALRHGRSFLGIELNPSSVELSRARLLDDAPLLNSAAEST